MSKSLHPRLGRRAAPGRRGAPAAAAPVEETAPRPPALRRRRLGRVLLQLLQLGLRRRARAVQPYCRKSGTTPVIQAHIQHPINYTGTDSTEQEYQAYMGVPSMYGEYQACISHGARGVGCRYRSRAARIDHFRREKMIQNDVILVVVPGGGPARDRRRRQRQRQRRRRIRRFAPGL